MKYIYLWLIICLSAGSIFAQPQGGTPGANANQYSLWDNDSLKWDMISRASFRDSIGLGRSQIFTDTVDLSSMNTKEVYPEWWGADPDDTTGLAWMYVAGSLAGTSDKHLVLNGTYYTDSLIAFVNMGNFEISGGSIQSIYTHSDTDTNRTIWVTTAASITAGNDLGFKDLDVTSADFDGELLKDSSWVSVVAITDFSNWVQGDLVWLKTDTVDAVYGEQEAQNGGLMVFDSLDTSNKRVVFKFPAKRTIYTTQLSFSPRLVNLGKEVLKIDNLHLINTQLKVTAFENVFISNSSADAGEGLPETTSGGSIAYSGFNIQYCKNIFFDNIDSRNFHTTSGGYGIIVGQFINCYIDNYIGVDNKHATTTNEGYYSYLEITNSTAMVTNRTRSFSDGVREQFDTHWGGYLTKYKNCKVIGTRTTQAAFSHRSEHLEMEDIYVEDCGWFLNLSNQSITPEGKDIIFRNIHFKGGGTTGGFSFGDSVFVRKFDIDGFIFEPAVGHDFLTVSQTSHIDSLLWNNIQAVDLTGNYFILLSGYTANITKIDYGKITNSTIKNFDAALRTDNPTTPELYFDNCVMDSLHYIYFLATATTVDTTTDNWTRFEVSNSRLTDLWGSFINRQSAGDRVIINDWYFINNSYNNIASGMGLKGTYDLRVSFIGGDATNSTLFDETSGVTGVQAGDPLVTIANMSFYDTDRRIVDDKLELIKVRFKIINNNFINVESTTELLYFEMSNVLIQGNSFDIDWIYDAADSGVASWGSIIELAFTSTGQVIGNIFNADTTQGVIFLESSSTGDSLFVGGNTVHLGETTGRFFHINNSTKHIYGLNTIESINATQNAFSQVPKYSYSNSSSATLVNGQTAIVVTHGMSYTPIIDEISVTAIETLNNASFWFINTVTATQFTINVDADPGQDVDFVWQIIRQP